MDERHRTSDPRTGEPQPIDLLITGGVVLTMDSEHRILHEGAVAIDQGWILALGDPRQLKEHYAPSSVLDGTGMAILPGLVDTYGHGGHGMIKGIHRPDAGWPNNDLYFHKTTKAWWRAEGRLAALERLRFGVTCGLSVVGGTPARMDSTDYASAQAQAYLDLGLRGVIAVGPPDPFLGHLPEPWSASTWDGDTPVSQTFTYDEALEHSLEFIQAWHNQGGGRIQTALAYPYLFGRQAEHPRIPFKYGDHHVPVMIEKAEEIRSLTRKLGVLLHSHAFVGSLEFALDRYGAARTLDMVGPDLLLAHCNGLSPREVEVLGSSGTGISVVPYTHENLLYGPCPVIELLDAGAVVTITTDGTAPYTSYDLLKEVPRAIWAQWQRFRDQHVLPPGKALRMITIEAARALGLESEIGSIETGKRADLIMIDLRRPHLTPNALVPRQLAFYANGNDVDTVIVGGKVLMRHREVLLADEADIVREAREEAAIAFERFDISAFTTIEPAFWENTRYGDGPADG